MNVHKIKERNWTMNYTKFPQEVEKLQLKNAAVKHTTEFLHFNPNLQTLELCSMSVSGSYISNPISNFRLDSVLRLSFPKEWNKEDIIRVRIEKNNEIFCVDFAASVLYTPQKLILGLAGIGITFSVSLNPKDLGKLLADYFAKNMIFANAAVMPCWAHHPTEQDKLTFLFLHEISEKYVMDSLRKKEVNFSPDIGEEEIFEFINTHFTLNLPTEMILLSSLKSYSLLQTLFYNHGVSQIPMINIILEKNSREYRQLLTEYLSIYKKPQIYTLPLPQAELKKLINMHRDDFIFLSVPQHKLPQYQSILLLDNLSLLQQTRELRVIPIIISSGYLNGINSDDMFCIPITEQLLQTLQPKTFTILNGFHVFFLKYMEKNLDIFDRKLQQEKEKTSQNVLVQLFTTHALIMSFLDAHARENHLKNLTYFIVFKSRIKEYIEKILNSDVALGLSEQFLQILRNGITAGTIIMHNNTQAWHPETMSTATILFDKSYAYVPLELFERIIEKKFCQIPGLTILKNLQADGYLIADESGQRHYKKKGRYIDRNGHTKYMRFITLKLDAINRLDEPRLF